MALPAYETFTGTPTNVADRTGWATVVGAATVFSGGAIAEASVACLRWSGDTFANNQYALCTSVASGANTDQGAGVCVRAQSGANSYYFVRFHTSRIKTGIMNAGTETVWDTSVSTRTAGYVLRLEISGTAITSFYNGTQIYTTTDSTFSSGSAGIAFNGYNYADIIDNWEGGDIGAAAGHPTMLRWQGIPGMKYTGRKGW